MVQTQSRLATAFAGLALKSPIVAASAPPTESSAAMRACAGAGIGAVVTKSILDYQRSDWPAIPRRVKRNGQRYWIQGSFASETLTLDEGMTMVAATRDAVDVPIIASVGVLDPTSDAPIETASHLIEAGADMVHYDLFYLAQPRCTDAMMEALRGLFIRSRAALPTPFGPKLNADIPAHLFAAAVEASAIDAVFLLDSIRVPPPLNADGAPMIDAWRGGLECSLFGSDWQKPISLQYTRILADARMPYLCVGGGLRSADDILEAIMLGATTAQVATQLIIQGYDWVARTNDRLEELLEQAGCSNLSDLRGLGLRIRDRHAPEHVTPMQAVVDTDQCNPCGVCIKLAFCPYIDGDLGQVPTISDACYGCGLCAELCPTEAIRIEAAK